MKRSLLAFSALFCVAAIFLGYTKNQQQNDPSVSSNKNQYPNIVYILADDLGIGDVGCFGQKTIKTPNIDRIAAQGILFNNHYSGSTVCAPSRSVLMTGQHTGHTPIRDNRGGAGIEGEGGEGQTPMAANALTIAELLKQKGYATGAFG